MILQNYEKDFEERPENSPDLEAWVTKNFCIKLMNFDLEEFIEANANKKVQIVQILALISQFVSQSKTKLKDFKLYTQFK